MEKNVIHTWSDKDFKGTSVNRTLPSLHQGSLEITIKISLIKERSPKLEDLLILSSVRFLLSSLGSRWWTMSGTSISSGTSLKLSGGSPLSVTELFISGRTSLLSRCSAFVFPLNKYFWFLHHFSWNRFFRNWQI